MPLATLSSREFNQDIGKAKRAADDGPVVITDRGRPVYVLLKHEDYSRLAGLEKKQTLFDLLGQTGPEADFDFDPARLGGDLLRPIDLEDVPARYQYPVGIPPRRQSSGEPVIADRRDRSGAYVFVGALGYGDRDRRAAPSAKRSYAGRRVCRYSTLGRSAEPYATTCRLVIRVLPPTSHSAEIVDRR